MKILSQTTTQEIECSYCGAVLEITKEDLKLYELCFVRKREFENVAATVKAKVVICPVCSTKLMLHTMSHLPHEWQYATEQEWKKAVEEKGQRAANGWSTS